MTKTSHRALSVSVAAAAALILASCGGGGGGDEAAAGEEDPAAELGPADVTIVNFGYEDAEYTTSVGETVTWVNEGAAPHTVTGDAFDSGIIRSGSGFEHTFEEPGTYEYWCTNHEGAMSGTIIVE